MRRFIRKYSPRIGVRMINEIINWCNLNNGFATILLSVLTLLVSIIAVIVSIHTARLPYKKKLLISAGSAIRAAMSLS